MMIRHLIISAVVVAPVVVPERMKRTRKPKLHMDDYVTDSKPGAPSVMPLKRKREYKTGKDIEVTLRLLLFG